MNERIEELAYQAEQYAYTDNVGMQCQLWRDKFQTKFAELIVKECANWIDDQPLESIHDNYLNGWELLEHFGVE